MLRSAVPRSRCALERGCCCRGGRGLLPFEEGVVVGIGSSFEGGRTEARRPGTGKKNFEVLPMAADGRRGDGCGSDCDCGGEVFF